MSKEPDGGNSRSQIHHPQEESFVSKTWRPQPYAEGMPENRGGLQETEGQIDGNEPTRPTVMREVAFSAQDSDGAPAYTRPPGESTERGGDAPGGVLRTTPGNDINDQGRDPVPADPPEEVHIVDAPGVKRANGYADLTDGSATDDSWREGIDEQPGDRSLEIKRDGAWEAVLTHKQDDTSELRGEVLRGGTMKWQDEWEQKEYEKDDVVRDGNWTMVANKDTDDRPAPQPIGAPTWTLDDLPTWSSFFHTGTVRSGVRVSNTTGLWQVVSARAWLPDVRPSVTYRRVVTNHNTGQVVVGPAFSGDVLPAAGWLTVVESMAVWPDSDLTFALQALNSATTTDFNHPWNYIGSSNQENDPGTGNVEHNSGQTLLRFSHDDDDGIDRSAEIASVIPGTSIRMEEAGDPSVYFLYQVTGTTDYGDYSTFNVTLTAQVGSPSLGTVNAFFSVPVPLSTEYVQAPGAYAAEANIDGELYLDGVAQPGVEDDGFGFDIRAQEYTSSPDWDLVAHMDTGDSGTVVETVAQIAMTSSKPALLAALAAQKVILATGTPTAAWRDAVSRAALMQLSVIEALVANDG